MGDTTELEKIRLEIDNVNIGILDLLSKRSELIDKVIQAKRVDNIEPLQPKRYQAMLSELELLAESKGISKDYINEVFDVIHKYSLKQQHKEDRNARRD